MKWSSRCVLIALLLGSSSSVFAAEISAKADRFVASFAKKGDFMGAVLVARNGHPLFRHAYGWADAEWRVPNSTGSKFNIASLTKQFTGMAVLQLIDDGKLSLSDPISKFIPDAPPSWSAITVEQLESHSSGIPGPSSLADFPKGIAVPYTPEELVRIFEQKPLAFPPGKQFQYSNPGYYTLGYIIEKVSGEPYAQYLQRHIFTPLAMSGSGFDSVQQVIPKKAVGYALADHKLQRADYVDWTIAYAAGAVYSTIGDYLRWDRGLEHLVKPETLQRLKTPTEIGYNFGWFVLKDSKGRLRMHHEGSNPGFAAYVIRYPDEGLLVVVLANLESAPVGQIANGLAAIAHGEPLPKGKE